MFLTNLKTELKTLQCWNLITHYIECALMLHSYFSFSTWQYGFIENGFYDELDKDQRDQIFSRLFVCIVALGLSFTSVTGFVIDKYGSWAARMIGKIFIITGIFINLFTTKELQFLIFPGWILFVGGGMICLDTNMYCYILYRVGLYV